MSEINHENVLIQIRDALNRNSIKLWEEPYCVFGESVESEVVVSKRIFFGVKHEFALIVFVRHRISPKF